MNALVFRRGRRRNSIRCPGLIRYLMLISTWSADRTLEGFNCVRNVPCYVHIQIDNIRFILELVARNIFVRYYVGYSVVLISRNTRRFIIILLKVCSLSSTSC